MPFLRFHFVDTGRLSQINRKMTDRLQQAMGCPREHIVVENVNSVFLDNDEVKNTNNWPFVEVDYFERPLEIQNSVAKIIYESLKEAGYIHADVHFRYLISDNYYTDGEYSK